ncbi:MAG: hypothetical protein OXI87_09560 [Albidovulum sp.]|nr:hypothetical protein [Albidovulum sp.]
MENKKQNVKMPVEYQEINWTEIDKMAESVAWNLMKQKPVEDAEKGKPV